MINKIDMYIRFFALMIILFCKISSFAQWNMSLDNGATMRNTWLLGNAMLKIFGEDRIAEWIDHRGLLDLVLEIDNDGKVLQCYKCISRNTFDRADSTAIIDYLKRNNVRFTKVMANEFLRYTPREELVEAYKKDPNKISVLFPGEMAISEGEDRSKCVLRRLRTFSDNAPGFRIIMTFVPTSEDYNDAVLFTTLIYLYGENTVYDWLKERKNIMIEAFVKPDGQIIDVKCEYITDPELPKSLREDIINFWNLYDCRLRPLENQKEESVIELKFPCLSDDNNDIYEIFSRMRYIIVSSFTPDSQLL